MSHHIDLNFSVLPPGKEPVSKKLQQKNAETVSAKKRESKKLDIDNKQMEWRLQQLKKVMEKEKEVRGKQNFHWQSGQNTSNVVLESHARNTLGHSVRTSGRSPLNSSKKPHSPTKPRVKVLKDEPLDIRERPSHTKELIGSLLKGEKHGLPQVPTIEEPVIKVNKETWISIALDPSQEDIMEMQSDQDGNLPLSCLTAMEPNSIGVYFKKWGRKRLMLAVDGRIVRPKQGWGSEVYFPYIGNVSPQKVNDQVTPVAPKPAFKRKVHPPIDEQNNGGSLLDGTFNEDDSAESFKQAIMEWRQKKPSQPKQEERVREPAPVEMSVHSVQCEPVEIDIKFSETSTLSFMERVLLKKHRSTDVPPLSTIQNDVDSENEFGDENMALTEEEADEHERIRQLFSPRQNVETLSNMGYSVDNQEQSCLITEIEDSEMPWIEEAGVDEESSSCFVEESDVMDNDLPLARQSRSTISIEEITYGEPTTSPPTAPSPYQPQVHTMAYNIPRKTPVPKRVSPRPDKKTPFSPHRPQRSKSAIPVRKRGDKLALLKNGRPKTSASGLMAAKSTDSSLRNDRSESRSFALVSAIGRLPLNPDANYNHGLGEFFLQTCDEPTPSPVRTDDVISRIETPADVMLCNRGAEFWQPFESLTLDDGQSPESDAALVQKHVAQDYSQEIPVEQENVQDTLEMEKADANALEALEWELASQTGNITSDGRISRLIDEWSSSEEDLGIINDTGLGSGLSSPEVDHRSLGSAMASARNWETQDDHDFEEMEQLVMADLRNESSSEEDEDF